MAEFEKNRRAETWRRFSVKGGGNIARSEPGRLVHIWID